MLLRHLEKWKTPQSPGQIYVQEEDTKDIHPSQSTVKIYTEREKSRDAKRKQMWSKKSFRAQF